MLLLLLLQLKDRQKTNTAKKEENKNDIFNFIVLGPYLR